MQQEWRQAVQGWQTYSQELAQLGERLDAGASRQDIREGSVSGAP